MNGKIKAFFENSLGYLAVAAVSLFYILAGLFVPGLTGKSIATIIAEGLTGFILGIAINFNLNLQGILKGKRAPEMQATKKAHGEAVAAIEPHIHRLDEWCSEQNDEKLKQKRARILADAAMRYDDCFDENGLPKPQTPLELPTTKKERRTARKRKRQCRRALRAALRARITPLSTSALTCDGERADDPFDFGETPEQYQRRTNFTDAITKVMTAGVFGYFGVDMVEEFDAAMLLWRGLYVAIILALGVSKLMRSYLFVADTYRGNQIKKINYLQAFKNWAEQTPGSEERK